MTAFESRPFKSGLAATPIGNWSIHSNGAPHSSAPRNFAECEHVTFKNNFPRPLALRDSSRLPPTVSDALPFDGHEQVNVWGCSICDSNVQCVHQKA